MIENTPLRDAMHAISLAKRIPDAELLGEYVQRYPQYADALIKFAVELVIDALMEGEIGWDIPLDLNPTVSRVMSQFEWSFGSGHKPA